MLPQTPPGKNPSLPLPSFWWLPVILGILWPVVTPVSASAFTWLSSLCVCLCLCVFTRPSFFFFLEVVPDQIQGQLLLGMFGDILFKVYYLFIYLFMAVLGLRFCVRAFSSCGKWGPLFIAVRRPLIIAASLVAEHGLQTRRLSNCGSRA